MTACSSTYDDSELIVHLYMYLESVLIALNLKMLAEFGRNKLRYKDSTSIFN